MIPSVVVADSDVVPFAFKRDTRADVYCPHLAGRDVVISFMTLAELHRWARERNWGARRQGELEEYLDLVHGPPFRPRPVLLVGRSSVERASGGTSDPDGVAATGLLHGVPLVTHNPEDYQGVSGLMLITESGS